MVLIFSNEPPIAQLLNLLLLAQGYPTFTAGINEVAVATFTSLRPTCVIVDTPHVAQAHPLQLITTLRQQAPQVGIMICTGVYSRRFEPYLVQAGVDDVLRKPFTLETARRQIRQLYTLTQQRTPSVPNSGEQANFLPPATGYQR